MTDSPAPNPRRPSILVVCGTGEHSDPWHNLKATSGAIAAVVAGFGDVRLIDTNELNSSQQLADLMVVNTSADLSAPPTDSNVIVDVIAAHHRAGRPILAMHSAVLAFPDDRRWADILGGRWEPGVSMHPQIGRALVQRRPLPNALGIPAFANDFVLYDERYSFLTLTKDVRVVADHTEDGLTHPLVWWSERTSQGGAVAYDALGHGVESFDSDEHRTWVLDASRSLLATFTGPKSGEVGER